MTLERIFRITPAYDLTSHPRNYGISSMRMFFAVKGPLGGVSCSMHTSWYLPHNQASSYEMFSEYPFDPLKQMMQPHLVSLDMHSHTPQYEDQYAAEDCEVTGGKCYGDGTSLWFGEAWMEGFLHGGTEWLWPRLEELYEYWLADGPAPNLTPTPVTIEDK